MRDFSPDVPLSPSKDEEVEAETEEQGEEEDGAKAKQKDEKKRKKRRKKKRKKMKKSKSKGETTEEEEEEREGEKGDQEDRKGAKNESPQMRLEALRKSTALVLFRDFAKTVYAPRHSQFQLFSSLEDLVDAPSSPQLTPPAAKGTPSP